MSDSFEIDGPQPLEPGITPAPEAHQGGLAPFDRKQLSPKTKLADIQDDFAFYHPGLLYERIPLMGKDPFMDFAAQKDNSALKPILFAVGKQVVKGFNNPVLGYTVYSLEKPIFNEYIQFLNSTMFLDRKEKTFWRIRYQTIRISDPSDSRTNCDRTIGVTFFGLETSVGSWYFDEANPWCVEIKSTPELSPETRNLAIALFQEDLGALGEMHGF